MMMSTLPVAFRDRHVDQKWTRLRYEGPVRVAADPEVSGRQFREQHPCKSASAIGADAAFHSDQNVS